MINAHFTCNICGTQSVFNPSDDWRESPSCIGCWSSVRSRQLVHCVTSSILGSGVILPWVKEPNIRGIGLSDPDGLADHMVRAFNYTNTYYHTEPRLDICNPKSEWVGEADFLISSDVFEHVPSPVQLAFDGAFRILRPGGTLVLTVPFDERPETTEHFENVRDFRLLDFDGEWLLVGKTKEDRYELHNSLVFHGGPGTVVEMRFFSRHAVIAHLKAAGFTEIHIHDDTVPEYGIFPPHHQGLPITAKKPL